MQGPHWSPEGLQRFLGFLSCYSGFALFRVPWWVIGLVIVISSGQVLAFCAVACLFLVCLVLGRLAVPSDERQRAVIASAVGMAIIQMVVACTAWIPIHYAPLYWIVCLAFLFVHRDTLRTLWIQRRLHSAGWQGHILIFVLLCHLITATKPEVSADGLSMHMAILDILRSEHAWTFDVTRYSWAVMPMAGDWSFAPAYMMGGELAARWWNWLCLCGVCGVVFELLRNSLQTARSLLLTALFASTPLVQLVTGSLLVENPWALFLTSGLYCSWRCDPRAAALLLGASCAAKMGSWLPALAVLLFLPMSRSLGWFLLFAAPPYVGAWLRTGNPVFPFANAFFRARQFDIANSFVESRFQEHLGWDALYRLTFDSHLFFEGRDGSLGFQYLLLLPLAIVYVARFSRLEWLNLAVIASSVTGLLFSQRNLRYLYPALPAASVLLSVGLRSRSKLVEASVVILLLVNLYYLPNSGWHHRDFLTPPWLAAEYRDQQAPVRSLIDYLNTRHPGVPVVFLVSGQTAGLRAPAFVNSWHQYPFHSRALLCRTGEDWRRLILSVGAGFVIGPVSHSEDPGVREFLQKYAVSVMSVGDCRLFEVSR